MSTVCISTWSLRSLSEGLKDEDSVRSTGGARSWLVRLLRNLREPTALELFLEPFDHMRRVGPFDRMDRRQEDEFLKLVFETLKVNHYITELNVCGLPDIHIIDQTLEANNTITKLVLGMDEPNVEAISCLVKRGQKIDLYFENSEYDYSRLGTAMPENATIKLLSLSSCKLPDTCMESICKAVRSCSALSKLDLSDTNIEDFEATSAIGAMLKENSTLTELILRDNPIGRTIRPILDALLTNSTLKKLDLANTGIIDGQVICIAKVIRENSTLTELCLAGFVISQRDMLDALQHNTTLVKLEFEGITSKLIASFADMIRHNSSLTELSCLPRQVTGIRAFSKNQTLRVLDVTCWDMSFQGIQALGEVLKRNRSLLHLKLKSASYDRCSRPFQTFAQGLKANCSLKSLRYEGLYEVPNQRMSIGIAIADALAANTGLESLTLAVPLNSRNECVRLLAVALETNNTLKELTLLSPELDDDAVCILARGLIPNTSLKSLDVHSLSGDAGIFLAASLSSNTSLEILKLGEFVRRNPFVIATVAFGNYVKHRQDEHVIVAFAKALKTNTSLKELWLPCDLRTDGVGKMALIEACKDNAAQMCKIFGNDPETGMESGSCESPYWFYHRLNRTGRCCWTDSAFPAKLWPRALALADARSSPKGPDVLFHFIVERPEIFKDCFYAGQMSRKRARII